MSYLSPERALGAPQREGERRMDGWMRGVGGGENLSVMKGRALTGCNQSGMEGNKGLLLLNTVMSAGSTESFCQLLSQERI